MALQDLTCLLTAPTSIPVLQRKNTPLELSTDLWGVSLCALDMLLPSWNAVNNDDDEDSDGEEEGDNKNSSHHTLGIYYTSFSVLRALCS